MKLQSFDKEYTDNVNHDNITSYSSTTTRQSISASTDYTPFRSLHLSKSNDNINIDDTLLFQSFDNSGIAAIDVADDSGNNPLHNEPWSSASTGSQPQRILAGIRKLVSVVTACSSSCSCPLDQDDDAILIHEGTIIEYPAKKSLQRNQSIDDNITITDITSVTGIGYGYQRNKYWLNEYGINDVSY